MKNSALMYRILMGIAIGDALGVPVEFKNRRYLDENPITDMVGYGTHNQEAGTWSDDTSLALALAEALSKGYDLGSIAQNFVAWLYDEQFTARGKVFDIGISTRAAIDRIERGTHPPEYCGGTGERENGNGSLMRILPMLIYTKEVGSLKDKLQVIQQVSAITHGHFRSFYSCFLYLEFAELLLETANKDIAYAKWQKHIKNFQVTQKFSVHELANFDRLLLSDISKLPKEQIQSSGYVVHSLESSIWCLMTTNSYHDCVLKAVNLGDDTDTTAAIAGGIAGIYYGLDDIPAHWIRQLANKSLILEIAQSF